MNLHRRDPIAAQEPQRDPANAVSLALRSRSFQTQPGVLIYPCLGPYSTTTGQVSALGRKFDQVVFSPPQLLVAPGQPDVIGAWPGRAEREP